MERHNYSDWLSVVLIELRAADPIASGMICGSLSESARRSIGIKQRRDTEMDAV